MGGIEEQVQKLHLFLYKVHIPEFCKLCVIKIIKSDTGTCTGVF